jgi:uncharacterized protein (TIGR02117 family)
MRNRAKTLKHPLMQHAWGLILLAVALVLSGACGQQAPDGATIWFRSNGFHTAVVLPAPPPPGVEPDSQAQWYDCSWGDSAYFTTPGDPPLGMALRALFWPSPSVLHVRPLTEAERAAWARSEMFIPLRIDSSGLAALRAFVAQSFACDSAGCLQPVGAGWGRGAQFFRARGRYSAVYTCNSWTADALRAAGLRLPRWDLTARPLERSLRRLAAR